MQRYSIIGRKNDYEKSGNDYKEISVSAMKKTGQFIKEYKFWFLASPKARYDFTLEHFVLWEKNQSVSNGKNQELYELIEGFSKADYLCIRNSVSMQTVPLIVHYHIAKFKDIDKDILKLL